MDLDQLRTFLEIVRLKSFSKAAQTCFRTQPAISAQVRQLEQELSTSLFERLGTRIALTPAGRIFADFAEQILDLRKRAQDSINELEKTPKGELVIAANEATCIYVLPLVFSEYKRIFPNVQLQVERSYGSRIVDAILENQADFGITQLPVAEKRLQVVAIHSDEIKLLAPAGHPLAKRDCVAPRDLIGYPLLMPKSGTTRTRLNEWLALLEEDLNISMELDATEMTKRFVLGGTRRLFPGGVQLPRRGRRRTARRGLAGSGTAHPASRPHLSQGQISFESGARLYSGGSGQRRIAVASAGGQSWIEKLPTTSLGGSPRRRRRS